MTEKIQDRNQNFWHLTSIQTASLGIPGIIVSKVTVNQYGAGAAFLSILIANLILWIIAFAIVSMSTVQRYNAIENAEAYIGRLGAKLVSLISMLVFPIWYAFQIHASTGVIDRIVFSENGKSEFTTIYAAIIGVLISFIALGKVIKIIKWVTTIFLPFLICYYLYIFFSFSDVKEPFLSKLEFSIPWYPFRGGGLECRDGMLTIE